MESEEMRVDKFLKVSRIIKRRTVANNACDAEHIMVNGKTAKPGARVKQGDRITVTFGTKTLTVKVLCVKEHSLKNDASSMYEVIEE